MGGRRNEWKTRKKSRRVKGRIEEKKRKQRRKKTGINENGGRKGTIEEGRSVNGRMKEKRKLE